MPEPGMGSKPEHSAPGRAGGTSPRNGEGGRRRKRLFDMTKAEATAFLAKQKELRATRRRFSDRRGSRIVKGPMRNPVERRSSRILR